MIQVYKADNSNYTKNGDITLIPIDAYTESELNGKWTATLTAPIDAEGRWKYLTEEAVVKMPSWNGDQLYRISGRVKEGDSVTCSLYPIFFDSTNDCFLVDVKISNASGQQALNAMLTNSKYTGQTNIIKNATAEYSYKNFMEALGGEDENAFLKRWGGEVEYDNLTVKVNDHLGTDRGLIMRYGLNIQNISEEVDMSGIITRIYPRAYNDRPATSYTDSPLINAYATVKTATMVFDWIKTSGDASEGDEDDPNIIICHNQSELDNALAAAVQDQFDAGLDKPMVNIAVDGVFDLSKIQGFEAWGRAAIGLGDTVHLIHSKLDIESDARIIYLKYDCMQNQVSDIQIGSKPYDFFQATSDVQAKVAAGDFDGKDGKDGASVIAVWIEWSQASARQIPAGGSYEDIRITPWSETIPTYVSGRFYWMRSVTRMSDDTVIYGVPIYDMSSQAAAEAQVAANTAQAAADDAQEIANNALGEINTQQNYFWHDSSGTHVSDTAGTVASGNSQTTSANGSVIMRNGKLVTSWTGSSSSNAALNFYDGSNATAQTSDLVASYSRSGISHYINNVLAMALTASGLSFYNPVADANYLEALFGSSGTKLYYQGNLLAEFLTTGLTIYNGSGTEIAHLGYGSGAAESGTDSKPYVTLGSRSSSESAPGNWSCVQGYSCEASAFCAQAEGGKTVANERWAHAEGYNSGARGEVAHAEGNGSQAYGSYSHAEGYGTTTTSAATASHAEGSGTTAESPYAHAEGHNTHAKGRYSHAEGAENTASGNYSHVEGAANTASGDYSHAGGRNNTAGYDSQTVIGKYNSNKSNTAFEIGWGASNARANIFEVYQDGNTRIAGEIQNMSGVNKYFRGAPAGISNSNLNNATASGHYGYSSGDTNAPTSSSGGALWVINNGGSYIHQIAFSFSSTPHIYFRLRRSGTWTSWATVL